MSAAGGCVSSVAERSERTDECGAAGPTWVAERSERTAVWCVVYTTSVAVVVAGVVVVGAGVVVGVVIVGVVVVGVVVTG